MITLKSQLHMEKLSNMRLTIDIDKIESEAWLSIMNLDETGASDMGFNYVYSVLWLRDISLMCRSLLRSVRNETL